MTLNLRETQRTRGGGFTQTLRLRAATAISDMLLNFLVWSPLAGRLRKTEMKEGRSRFAGREPAPSVKQLHSQCVEARNLAQGDACRCELS